MKPCLFPKSSSLTLVCSTVLLVWLSLATARHCSADAVCDLVVGYGATEASRFGGQSQLQAQVLNQIATANVVAYNSGAPHRQNVTGFIQSATDCDYLTSTGGMVGWLNGNDGHVSDVISYGNYLGADLITYIFKNGDGYAGVANQPGRYSAYNDQVYWTYFAHESGGHNFGGNHSDGLENPKTVMLNNYCGGGAQGYYTNPNIWLNGVQLLGTGNCQGSPIYGGDTAYQISTSAQGVADSYDRLVFGSNIGAVKYRWQFNKPAGAAPAGTVIADDISGAQAAVRGQGATFTGTGLLLPGGTTGNMPANSIAAYLDLPNGIFSAMSNFTIEIWATPKSVQNWMRIIDIGRTTQAGDGLGVAGEYTGTPGSPAPGVTDSLDDLLLSAAEGTNLNSQRFELKQNGANDVTVDSALTTNAGDQHHYAITFADTTNGGHVSWYRDGVLVNAVDVAFHSAQLRDVDNWLGRSLFSADSMSNIEYQDVRIQSIALNDGNVAGNYRIGPNDAKATLYYNDAYGYSGFNNGSWEFGRVPSPTRDYEVGVLRLLSPPDAANHTFPGRSLTVTGGTFDLVGTSSSTTTVNDLRMNGGTLIQLANGGGGNTQTLAGNLTVSSGVTVDAKSGPMVIASKVSGHYSMMYLDNAVTLTNDNSGFDGWTYLGDGRFSTLVISDEKNLGGNPPYYRGDWLTLDRGILVTTQTMAIDDPNRGVQVGPSGANFNPVAGTTLTIATPLNCPAAGNTVQTAPLNSNPIEGILAVNGAGTLELTHPNNSHNAEMKVFQGELRLSGQGRLNNGVHSWPFTLNGLFTDNSVLDQTLGGVLSGNGTLAKSNTSTLTLTGANTFSGSVAVNGGTLYANPGNGANGKALSYASRITVNKGGTLRAGPNGLFGWDGTQEHPITVNAGGILLADGGNTGDVGVGTVTLAGGTLASSAAATNYGSWRFDDASDMLVANLPGSTVSATNVKFGNPGAAINVVLPGSLNFTGTITDATAGGISYLTKNGAGVLKLAGTNNYSGATAINAGTLNLTGSLAGSSAVTVASGATLSGAGSIAGKLTFVGSSIHAPGNPVGVQTVGGALGYSAGSRVKFTLLSNSASAAAGSGVAASGLVTVAAGAAIDLGFNATGSAVDFSTLFWTQARQWPVVTGSGMAGSFTLGSVSNDSAGHAASTYGAFSLVQGSTGSTLQWTPRSLFAFQGTNFGDNLSNSAISGYLADPDGDGVPNVLEAFYGTNPNLSVTSPLQSQTAGGHLGLRFPRSTAITDVVAKIQGADAVTGPWTDLAQSVSGANFAPLVSGVTVSEDSGGTIHNVSFTDLYLLNDPAHPNRFLRLWVQPQ